MARIRIEYLRPRRGGDAYGISPDVVDEIAMTAGGVTAAETLLVGTTVVFSTPAPTFVYEGAFAGGVFARVTCEAGAVVLSSAAAAPVVEEAKGMRLEAGQPPLLLAVQTGYMIAFIESALPPRLGARLVLLKDANTSGPVVANVPGGIYSWTVQGTFGGGTVTLRERGPDGVNYIDLETLTAPGRKVVVIGEGKSVRAIVSGGAPNTLNSDIA